MGNMYCFNVLDTPIKINVAIKFSIHDLAHLSCSSYSVWELSVWQLLLTLININFSRIPNITSLKKWLIIWEFWKCKRLCIWILLNDWFLNMYGFPIFIIYGSLPRYKYTWTVFFSKYLRCLDVIKNCLGHFQISDLPGMKYLSCRVTFIFT